jgi:hypothetical protein
MPEQIHCPKCGAVIKRKAAAPAKVPAAAAPAATASAKSAAPPVDEAPELEAASSSSGHLWILGGLLGGVLLLGLILAVGIGYLMRGSDGDSKKDPNQLAKGTTDSQGNPGANPNGSSGSNPGNTVNPGNTPKKDGPGDPPQNIEPAKDKELPPPLEVQKAIDRGVAHMKLRFRDKDKTLFSEWGSDGHTGAAALGALALLEAKVPANDPAVLKALAIVRDGSPKMKLGYALSCVLLFLNRLDQAVPLSVEDKALVRTLALRLIAGQTGNGCWSYENPPITAKQEQELMQELATNRYAPHNLEPKYKPDNSNTQFALLALWGCRRHKIPVRAPLLLATANFQNTQNENGSWGYVPSKEAGMNYVDSGTCAGLLALAIEKTLREDKAFFENTDNDPPSNPKADGLREKGFEHLASVIGRTKDDPYMAETLQGRIFKASAQGDFYFLWSVERVGVIYGRSSIGGKDWYQWGSDVFLKNQRNDGSWEDSYGDFVDTAFALLFLTRGNLAKDLTESIRRRGE